MRNDNRDLSLGEADRSRGRGHCLPRALSNKGAELGAHFEIGNAAWIAEKGMMDSTASMKLVLYSQCHECGDAREQTKSSSNKDGILDTKVRRAMRLENRDVAN